MEHLWNLYLAYFKGVLFLCFLFIKLQVVKQYIWNMWAWLQAQSCLSSWHVTPFEDSSSHSFYLAFEETTKIFLLKFSAKKKMSFQRKSYIWFFIIQNYDLFHVSFSFCSEGEKIKTQDLVIMIFSP